MANDDRAERGLLASAVAASAGTATMFAVVGAAWPSYPGIATPLLALAAGAVVAGLFDRFLPRRRAVVGRGDGEMASSAPVRVDPVLR